MRLVFVSAQSMLGSTLLGRVLPLARELSTHHEIHITGLQAAGAPPVSEESDFTFHVVGQEPFTRSGSGKQRLKGLQLVVNMGATAWNITRVLRGLNPDVVILVKALPSNTAGVRLWALGKHKKIILDADDFELTANQLRSLLQRAAVHWSERTAAKLATRVITASPFLADHFTNLGKKPEHVDVLPTGFTPMGDRPVRSTTSSELLYIGSVSLSSGHRVDMLPDILAQVAEKYPTVKLVIAGSGDDEVSLREAFAKRNLDTHVRWHGRFTLTELPELLAHTPLIIDPIDASISERAKSSFRVAVATAYGLPLVSSDVGIRGALVPAILHSRLFATPGSSTEYVQKIISLWQQPLSTLDSAALIEHARQFTWKALAEKYERIITSL